MAELFSLEAVRAKEGDSLILHFGTPDAPKLVVIDGGPRGVYRKFLQPRLLKIKSALSPDDPLPLQAVGVSHIDSDHIAGVLELFEMLAETVDRPDPQNAPFEVKHLWHNGLRQIVDDADAADGPASLDRADAREADAVLASVNEGNRLDAAAKTAGIAVNRHFRPEGPILAGDDADIDGLKLQAIAPSPGRVKKLRDDWRRNTPDAEEAAALAAYLDESVYNLASVVLVARQGDLSMLLTGDARGDHIIEGLEGLGLLEKRRKTSDPETTIDFDIVKVPHHGSDNNVAADFFRRVRGRHYVISGDGKHHNPEVATLCMLSDARGDDEIDVWFTYEDGDLGLGEKLKGWERMVQGRNITVHYPLPGRDSVVVDLAAELKY